MTISDLSIIYLAGGAPFAVYFYLQNRHRLFLRHLIFKTVLNLIFWVPFSLHFVLGRLFSSPNGTFVRQAADKSDLELDLILKRIEQTVASVSAVKYYEFKETLNRYSGLSLSLLDENQIVMDSERQIFQFSPHENEEIGSLCLHRRNRRRLLFHQRLAAEDFAAAVFEISKITGDAKLLGYLSVELTKLLNDEKSGIIISQHLSLNLPTDDFSNVRNAEKILWNSPQPPKPTNREQISVNMNLMSRTNWQSRD